MKRRSPLRRIIVYGCALLLALFLFGPFVEVAVASLLIDRNLVAFPPHWFAEGLTLDNYSYILTGVLPQAYLVAGVPIASISQEIRLIPSAIVNSALIASAVALIGLVFGTMAAYAYTRLRFPMRQISLNFVLLSRLIPTVALAFPYYVIVQSLGLLNSPVAIIAIHAVLTLPFTVLMLRLYFRSIPEEIEESAQVEGASTVQVLWHITLPLSLPSLVATGLFAFMLSYSEFLFALLLITKNSQWTLPITFGLLAGNPDVSWSQLMASVMLGVLPTMLLVFPVWRFMVRSLVASAGR